jgi:hypothetical protein
VEIFLRAQVVMNGAVKLTSYNLFGSTQQIVSGTITGESEVFTLFDYGAAWRARAFDKVL